MPTPFLNALFPPTLVEDTFLSASEINKLLLQAGGDYMGVSSLPDFGPLITPPSPPSPTIIKEPPPVGYEGGMIKEPPPVADEGGWIKEPPPRGYEGGVIIDRPDPVAEKILEEARILKSTPPAAEGGIKQIKWEGNELKLPNGDVYRIERARGADDQLVNEWNVFFNGEVVDRFRGKENTMRIVENYENVKSLKSPPAAESKPAPTEGGKVDSLTAAYDKAKAEVGGRPKEMGESFIVDSKGKIHNSDNALSHQDYIRKHPEDFGLDIPSDLKHRTDWTRQQVEVLKKQSMDKGNVHFAIVKDTAYITAKEFNAKTINNAKKLLDNLGDRVEKVIYSSTKSEEEGEVSLSKFLNKAEVGGKVEQKDATPYSEYKVLGAIAPQTARVLNNLKEEVAKISTTIPQSAGAGSITAPVANTSPEHITGFVNATEDFIKQNIPQKSGSALVANREYGVNLDPENICEKGRCFTLSLSYLRDNLKDFPAEIRTNAGRELLIKASEMGLETPCHECFAAEKRITGYSAKSSEPGISLYKPGEIYKPTNMEILNHTKILRAYSFADMRAIHLPSLLRVMDDLSKVNLGIGGYTKNLHLPEILADAGFKINLSTGMTPDIGLPRKLAYEYSQRYPTVGVMHVAINRNDLVDALGDKKVHKIIPVHLGGGINADTLAKISHLKWEDFTAYQNETVKVPSVNRPVKLSGKSARAFFPEQDLEQAVNLIEQATFTGDRSKYLQAVKQASKILRTKIIPKFPQYTEHKGYHKLIGAGTAEYGQSPEAVPIDMSRVNISKAAEYFSRGDRDVSEIMIKFKRIADSIIRKVKH